MAPEKHYPRRLIRLVTALGSACLCLLFVTPAWAQAFGPKASREPFPARELERPLDIPRAWSEFTLAHTVKLGVGGWSPEGAIERFDNARWTYNTTLIRWRYGLARRAEMAWDVPIISSSLRNDELGTDTRSVAVGDVRFRYIYRIHEQEAPMTALVTEFEVKGPTGRETPGSYVGGPNQFSTFVNSTGTWDAYLGLAGKKQIGPGAFTGRIGYQRRFSGIAQYVVETTQRQFAGRIKPGDRLTAEVEALLQLGPIAAALRPVATIRGRTRTGVTSKNWLNPGSELKPVADSGGWALDLNGQLTVNATRGFDVHLMGVLPVRGEDLQFFPIEDLHPTYGPTFGGAVEVRF